MRLEAQRRQQARSGDAGDFILGAQEPWKVQQAGRGCSGWCSRVSHPDSREERRCASVEADSGGWSLQAGVGPE